MQQISEFNSEGSIVNSANSEKEVGKIKILITYLMQLFIVYSYQWDLHSWKILYMFIHLIIMK